jgi:hypothetical protein
MYFIESVPELLPCEKPTEHLTRSHSSFDSLRNANKPDMALIANGKPSHFLKISSEACFNIVGHFSSQSNILLKNSFFESTTLSGLIL